jgi:hypothetical protein
VCGTSFIGIVGLGWVAVQAQQHHEDATGTGMRMEMMGGAAHQAAMTPFVLPRLQSELGLSAQQVTQLGQLKQDMLSKGKEISGQIAAKRKELEGLLAAGTSKGDLVKRLYEEIGSLRGQQQYTAYDATLKMKAELTDAQRTKLAGMKLNEIHQAMMSRMTMSDMMEMMPFMGGVGMMGGMMMDGMMMDGMMMNGRMMMRDGMPGMPMTH